MASRRCNWACPSSGPRHAAAVTPSSMSCAGWEATQVVWWVWPTAAGIAAGNTADLCVFAPDDAFVVFPDRLHHRNAVTPYAEMALAGGVVRHSWLAGTPLTVTLDATQDPRRAAACSPVHPRKDLHEHPPGFPAVARSRVARAGRLGDVRERRIVRPERESHQSGTCGARRERLRAQGQGVRRVGDPSPPRARARLRDRPARGARRRPRRRDRHCVVHRQLSPRSRRSTDSASRISIGSAVAGRAVGADPRQGRTAGRHRKRVPGGEREAVDPCAAQHLSRRRGGAAARARGAATGSVVPHRHHRSRRARERWGGCRGLLEPLLFVAAEHHRSRPRPSHGRGGGRTHDAATTATTTSWCASPVRA